MTQFAKFLSKAVKRDSSEGERIAISFFSWGAMVLHAHSGPKPQVFRTARIELDPLLTENERRNAFVNFFAALGMKKLPPALLTWADGMTFRQLSMPEMPMEDLRKAFEWELKKKFFYEPEENLLGFIEVMPVEGEEGPERLYDLFYCEKKAAGEKLAFVQTVGLDIQTLVPESAALAAFVGDRGPEEGDVLVCEKDGPFIRIVIVRGNRAMLVRHLLLGPQDSLTDDVLGRIAEEIKLSVDFYEAQKFSRPVNKVLLAAFEEVERAQETLARLTGMDVRIAPIEKYLASSMPEPEKEVAKAAGSYFVSVIGSLMVRQETMNLAPEDIKSLGRKKAVHRSLNIALIGFAGLLCLVAGIGMVQVQLMKGELSNLQVEHDAISKKKQAYETTLGRERVRRTVIQGTVYVPSLLKEISYRIPAPLTLDEVRYNRIDQTLILKGEVSDTKREGPKSVTQFATNLSESIFMQSATVANTFQDEEGLLNFQIDGTVKGLL